MTTPTHFQDSPGPWIWERVSHEDAGLEIVSGMMRRFYEEEGLAFDEARQGAALRGLLAEREDADASRGAVFWLRSADAGHVATTSETRAGAMVAGYLVLTWAYSLEFGGRFVLLDELWLAPGLRGRGEGRRAVEFAAGWAQRRGASALRLEVGHGNTRARELYAKAGLVAHGRDFMTRRLA